MRKALGVLFAASLVASIAIATSPAGAANTTLPKCKSITGTQTFKPALPPLSSKTLVLPTTATNLQIKGCVGGGITSGKSAGSTKATAKTNCTKLFADAGKPAKATKATITWSNKQTSTTSNVLTVTKVTKTTINATLVTTYTAGLGKGKKSTAKFTATPNAGWCFKVAFSKTSFKSTSVK